MKKIMILAGGNDQIALIQELRRQQKNRVYIILIDMNPNAKAVPFADEFIPISTMDYQAVLNAAREKEIDMILTACGDQPLSTMVYVSEQLGLPCYLTSELVTNLTNKKYMKRKMRECEISTSDFVILTSKDDIELANCLQYPIVVKPVDSNGSKGVKKITCIEELAPGLDEAFSYSLSGDVVAEEFNAGPEISIDAYIDNGIAKILSVVELNKINENFDSFTIVQSHYPPTFKLDEKEILDIAQKIATSYGLVNSPLLIQAICTKNGVKVIEFSARMGGGSKYRSIEHYTGVDIMKVYVQMVLGYKPIIEVHKRVQYASMCYIYCNNGVYENVTGLDELVSDQTIDYYYTYKKAGTEITKSNTSSDRVAGFMVSGHSPSDVHNKIQRADSIIKILDADGNDIMKHNLYK